jgi:hypothetical protein
MAAALDNADTDLQLAIAAFHTLAVRTSQAALPATVHDATRLVAAGFRLIVHHVVVMTQIVLVDTPLALIGLNSDQTQVSMERKTAILNSIDITDHYMALREAILGILETHDPNGDAYEELLQEVAGPAVELAMALAGDLDENVAVALSYMPEFLHAIIRTTPQDYMNDARGFGLDAPSRLVAMMDLSGTPLLYAFSDMWEAVRDFIRMGTVPAVPAPVGGTRRKRRVRRARRTQRAQKTKRRQHKSLSTKRSKRTKYRSRR